MGINTSSSIQDLRQDFHDYIVEPFQELTKEIDEMVGDVLTPGQQAVVYAILAALPLAITYIILGPPFGLIGSLSVAIAHWNAPDLLSEHTWNVLHLSAGIYFLATTPAMLITSIKMGSLFGFIIGLGRGMVGFVITSSTCNNLVEEKSPTETGRAPIELGSFAVDDWDTLEPTSSRT